MSQERRTTRFRWPATRTLALLIAAGLVGAALFARTVRPSQVEVLNEPTKAREIRPFTTSFDPRFDPLPIEDEGH
jgi:hypothetical protein